ncbi:DUF6767 domain-containing protein [Aestuariimicrobium sp. T2.26MG-19.2B]|uniref:DUF6767 domain-containing protein n=1 Tax=Aestuariimicrobium sp. T2.26MG-19.2B TaxID=3040679 RepID=UPI00247799A6|nr:DUF6767 domain-containing protein [Aestuariimicrobium sp. T2.26MG-19.2B]CAI9409611.1 hypothetical protein AESSP_02270 [Aestuariimicrobium sp. T2.26MG-19.2B]
MTTDVREPHNPGTGRPALQKSFVQPMCPLRPGDRCSLCVPGATGPQDCGLVWLVMDDPELKDQLAEYRRAARHAS